MTTEFDLIRRYRGAFTSEECENFIEFIENFDKHNILVHDTENLHQVIIRLQMFALVMISLHIVN